MNKNSWGITFNAQKVKIYNKQKPGSFSISHNLFNELYRRKAECRET